MQLLGANNRLQSQRQHLVLLTCCNQKLQLLLNKDGQAGLENCRKKPRFNKTLEPDLKGKY